MDIDSDGTPRLSNDGAKLLADVLSKRADDRHDTLASQRNARRREADALRQAPSVAPEADADTAQPERPPQPRFEVDDSDGGTLLRWLLFLAIGVSAGVCYLLATSLESRPVRTIDVETVQIDSSEQTDRSELNELDDPEPLDVVAAEEVAREVAQIEPVLVTVAAEDIEVSVYDAAPSNGEVYSFALRIKSVSTDEELYTEDFAVRVENESGTPATTFSRFIHDTLPVNSSALATVRAEDAGPGQQFVVVWYDNVPLARIAIETSVDSEVIDT